MKVAKSAEGVTLPGFSFTQEGAFWRAGASGPYAP